MPCRLAARLGEMFGAALTNDVGDGSVIGLHRPLNVAEVVDGERNRHQGQRKNACHRSEERELAADRQSIEQLHREGPGGTFEEDAVCALTVLMPKARSGKPPAQSPLDAKLTKITGFAATPGNPSIS